jgi:methionyl-tRNA formyltransferase
MTPSGKPSVLFFGTPEFSLPALRGLLGAGYPVVGIVTQPDEPAGRKRIPTPPPVKIFALQNHIPVFQPERPDATYFARTSDHAVPPADLFVVAAYGKIIPAGVLETARRGAVNIHPSLLPRWRGPSPIQAAIRAGDERAGVTIMLMDDEMDHGPILAQREEAVSGRTCVQMHDILAQRGAELLVETLPRWIAGGIVPQAQDENRATYCKLLTRDDGRIHWPQNADEIERMIRAYLPWPGAWTIWTASVGEKRIKIESADAIDDTPPQSGCAGLVWGNASYPLAITTGRGSLAIRTLRAEGRPATDAASFLRGHPSFIGAVLA